MRRRPLRQMSMPFDHDAPASVLPAKVAQELVQALADLLVATASEAHHDEERDDAREDHR